MAQLRLAVRSGSGCLTAVFGRKPTAFNHRNLPSVQIAGNFIPVAAGLSVVWQAVGLLPFELGTAPARAAVHRCRGGRVASGAVAASGSRRAQPKLGALVLTATFQVPHAVWAAVPT